MFGLHVNTDKGNSGKYDVTRYIQGGSKKVSCCTVIDISMARQQSCVQHSIILRTVQDWKVGNINYILVAKYSMLFNCDVMFRNGLVEYYISDRYYG